MKTIAEAYKRVAEKLIQNSRESENVDTAHVYQVANSTNRRILNTEILSELLHPHSCIHNLDRLLEFTRLSEDGHSCLIAMEHFSNFDLPNFIYLLEEEMKQKGDNEAKYLEDGYWKNIAERIISIAGIKLNTESDFVRAFTEAYSRIVIYPSRSLTHLLGSKDFSEEWIKSQKINREALRSMNKLKFSQNIILIFPTGTRYRPHIPESRRGLAEVDSYIRNFEYFVPIAIAGNTLLINEDGDMSQDFVNPDCVVYNVGNIIETKQWRSDIRSLAPESVNTKQFVVDCLMENLLKLHSEAQAHREKLMRS